MKPVPYVIFALLSVLYSIVALSQKGKVTAEPSMATLYVDCKKNSNSLKIKSLRPGAAVLAILQGYATNGITAADLSNTGEQDRIIKLTKIVRPDRSFKSGKIEFVKLLDASGTLANSFYAKGVAAPLLPSINVEKPEFSLAIKASMSKAGYNMVNNVYNGRSEIPEFALGGEVIWGYKDATYFRQTVGVLIRWSVFSTEKEQVVYETTTGGYADSIRNADYDETALIAINRALEGVVYDKGFQNLVSKKNGEPTADKDLISISKPELNNVNANNDKVRQATSSLVTIETDIGISSGFVINESGYIITSNQVIKNAKKINAVLENGFILEATIVRSNEEKNIALLKISGNGFKFLRLNPSESLSGAGTDVLAVSPTDSAGADHITRCLIGGKKKFDGVNFIELSAAAGSCNNGGPLINMATGEVIGIIITSMRTKAIDGSSFAIPIAEVIDSLGLKVE